MNVANPQQFTRDLEITKRLQNVGVQVTSLAVQEFYKKFFNFDAITYRKSALFNIFSLRLTLLNSFYYQL